MLPRRRTLCFVLILVSLNVGSALTKYGPSSGSPTPQLMNSLLTAASSNIFFPDVPVAQKILPNQRLGFIDAFSFGNPQGASINTVSAPNYGIPNPNSLKSYSTSSTYLSPIEGSNSLIIEPMTDALTYPSDLESLTIIENYPPETQSVQVEAFAPRTNVAEIYQTPINVQIPSLPQLSPYIASPYPDIYPSQNIIQEMYPRIVNTEVTSVPVETTTLPIPSSDFGCRGPQLPVTLQINMASPWIPEPVVTVILQPQPTPSPCPSFDPSFGMSTGPIIVMERSKSRWKSLLPLLILCLLDGGCGNRGGSGCCCSQCSASTPIPFPVVIPTNNPIISRGSRSSRSKGKSKAPNDSNT